MRTPSVRPRIDDVFDEEDVLSFEPGLRIIQQPDVPLEPCVAVARGDEEVDLQRPHDLPDEVTEKDETSLQQSKDEQLAVRIRFR